MKKNVYNVMKIFTNLTINVSKTVLKNFSKKKENVRNVHQIV
jgi:hypothetical protein